MNTGEIGPVEMVKGFVAMVRADYHDAMEATRPAEPPVPIIPELVEDWRWMREAFPLSPGARIEGLGLMVMKSTHTLYGNVVDRRLRFRRRSDAVLDFLAARVEEHMQEPE